MSTQWIGVWSRVLAVSWWLPVIVENCLQRKWDREVESELTMELPSGNRNFDSGQIRSDVRKIFDFEKMHTLHFPITELSSLVDLPVVFCMSAENVSTQLWNAIRVWCSDEIPQRERKIRCDHKRFGVHHWQMQLWDACVIRLDLTLLVGWLWLSFATGQMKPNESPKSPETLFYNKMHRKLQSVVERAIGLLKARFRCLSSERKLRSDSLLSGYIIYACNTLHSFLITANYPVDDIEPVFENQMRVFEEGLIEFGSVCTAGRDKSMPGGMKVVPRNTYYTLSLDSLYSFLIHHVAELLSCHVNFCRFWDRVPYHFWNLYLFQSTSVVPFWFECTWSVGRRRHCSNARQFRLQFVKSAFLRVLLELADNDACRVYNCFVNCW